MSEAAVEKIIFECDVCIANIKTNSLKLFAMYLIM